MERDLWRCIVSQLKALPRRRPIRGRYDNRQVLALLFWAALHNQSIFWACQRENWPSQAHRRKLPDQSTMSRRLRDPKLDDDINFVLRRIQGTWKRGRVLITDGKPYHINRHSTDPDARTGYGAGEFMRGYKLHVVIDDAHQVQGWAVHPMNTGESCASADIVKTMPAPRAKLMLGDAAYDSNPLHEASAERDVRLIAPRRKPHTGLGQSTKHHPNRLYSIEMTESPGGWMWPMLQARRTEVERFFAGLTSSAVNAAHLPTWIRRLHRVRRWIGAKLAINAARIALRRTVDA
jgi:hypothetical protein